MSRINNRGRGFLGIASLCAIGAAVSQTFAFSANSASAQITPDTSLPNNSSVTTEAKTFNITGGSQAGGNLFHSFGEFSVPTGSTAFFNNAVDIQNIISRVTGGSISNIDGLIRANGNANLFLLNPNGIIFGRNASLNIGGSFLASTASSLKFADGTQFSATAPQAMPLLTISVPIGLQYGANPGRILVQGNGQGTRRTSDLIDTTVGLRVQADQTLALVGGDVALEGGTLKTAGGRIELGSVAGSSLVSLTPTAKGWTLGYEKVQNFRDIQLLQQATVDASGEGGGDIQVQGRRVTLTGSSQIETSTLGSKPGGTLGVTAKELLELDGPYVGFLGTGAIPTGLFAQVYPEATGKSGDINIKVESLSINSARLSTVNEGQGSAGSISVQAGGNISVAGQSTISSYTFEQGDAGSILVQADGNVSITDSRISSYASGQGSAGSISVQAGGNISLIGSLTNIFSETYGQGNAGSVSMQADGNVSITDAGIRSDTFGQGDAGSISVQAGGNVSVAGFDTTISSQAYRDIFTETIEEGNAGSISVQAGGNFSITDSFIYTTTFGQGDAGSISMQAGGNVSMTNAKIQSNTTNAEGDAGSISVQAGGNVSLVAGSYISNSVSVGSYTPVSSYFTDLSSVDSYSTDLPVVVEGKGGNIDIQARSLLLTDGSILLSSTQGQGDAGNIRVNTSDSIIISGFDSKSYTNCLDFICGASFSSGLITNTEAGASGQAGNISVKTGVLTISDGAILSARTNSNFDGGDITVNANTLKLTNGGQILTTAFSSGNAGSIIVNTDSTILSGNDPTTYFDRLNKWSGPLVLSTIDRVFQITAPRSLVEPSSPDSGLFANTDLGSTGKGGDIFVNSTRLTVQDGAKIAVNSQGNGEAGNIKVQAGNLTLKNQALISAETFSSQGGNIEIGLKDILLLRQGSRISTNAGTERVDGNGGNITINAPDSFIVAVPRENSDISANAFTGKGGRVDIKAFGIYGIQPRQSLTSLSDITASSEFGVDGTIELNTPDIDPSRGLVNLPTVALDTEVSQICQPRTAQNQSSFIITGRGGLPPNPRTDLLTPDAVQVDWVTLKPSTRNRSNSSVSTKRTTATPEKIVEATGWVRNEKGEVVLTANPPTVTPHGSWQKPAPCSAIQSNK